MTDTLSILYNPKKSTPPNGWRLIRVGNYAKLVAGGTPSTRVATYWEQGDILWMRSGDVHKKRVFSVEGRITRQGLENSSATLLPKNSVLVALAGQGKTRGTVAINKVELSTNQSVAAIIPKQELDYEFLYYNLDARYESLRRLSTGDGGRGGLNLQILKNIWCVIPPFPEQRKIADILSSWDEAIAKTEQLIAALQKRKKGLMQRLLTGEVRFAGFDDERKEFRLDKIGTFLKGSGISKSDLVEDGIPCVRYGEIYTTHDFVIKEFHSFITREVASTSKQIFAGDILFAGSGETADEIGKCVAFIGQEEAYAGGDLIILRLSKGDPVYMGYLLNHESVKRQKYRFGQGYSVVHIYARYLKDIIITIPSLKEQRRIASVLQDCDVEINLHERKLTALQQQKKGLMQRLLMGQVRVKV